jgi:hypothetical protein
MKTLLLLFLLAAFAVGLFVPLGGKTIWARAQERGLPLAAARLTARGLRASWNFVAGLGQRPSPHATQQAQAHSPQRRAWREGIVPQPPKEKLQKNDRAALDKLVAGAR